MVELTSRPPSSSLSLRLRRALTRPVALFLRIAPILIGVFAVTLGVTLTVTPLAAEDQVFVSEISPRSGGESDIYRLQLSWEGDPGGARPKLEETPDFDVRYIGPQRSVTIMNGTFAQRTIFTYQLTPRRRGDLKVPGARITVAGREYRVAARTITVSKDDSSFREGISVTQQVTPHHAVVGEQVVLTTTITSDTTLYAPRLDDLSIDQVWSEEIGKPTQFRRIGPGGPVDVIEVKRALYPLAPGEIEIPSRNFTAQVRVNRNRRGGRTLDPFETFGGSLFSDLLGGGALTAINLRTESAKLTVVPLPQLPGSSFLPLVGATTIEVEPATLGVKTGESARVIFTVRSLGNLNPLKELPIDLPPDFKSYPERGTSRTTEIGGKLEMERTYPLALVPLTPGTFEIGPVRIEFFDPGEKRIKRALSPIVTLEVQGSAVVHPTPERQGSSGERVSDEGSERPAHNNSPPLYRDPTPIELIVERTSPALILFALITAIVVGGAGLSLWWGARRRREDRDLARRIAVATAPAELRALAAYALGLPEEAGYDRVRRAVYERKLDAGRELALELAIDELENGERGLTPLTPAQIARVRARLTELATQTQ